MTTFEEALIALGESYSATTTKYGGRSLARVATIIVNRGSFFDALKRGGTCTGRNIDKIAAYFGDPANWPDNIIPSEATEALKSIGRPAHVGDYQ